MNLLDSIINLSQAATACCGSVKKIILDETAFNEATAMEQYCIGENKGEPHKIAGIVIEKEKDE